MTRLQARLTLAFTLVVLVVADQGYILAILAAGSGVDPRRGCQIGFIDGQRPVQTHGGRIWVESVLGQGSTCRFTLPSGRGYGWLAPFSAIPTAPARGKAP